MARRKNAPDPRGPFSYNLASVEVRHKTPSMILRELSAASNRAKGPAYIRTAKESGWMTNGHFAYLMGPKEVDWIAKVPVEPGYANDMPKIIRPATRSLDPTPVEVMGVRQGLEDEDPQFHVRNGERGCYVNAVYYRTVRHRHPDAVARMSTRHGDPVVFLREGVPVGLVMPLDYFPGNTSVPYAAPYPG